MDMRYVLLSPNGRLAPQVFARGLILLTGAVLAIHVLGALGASGIQMFQLALVYPYACVFGKRLHDAGLTAWIYLAFLAGYLILGAIVESIVLPITSPEGYRLMSQFQDLVQQEGLKAGTDFFAANQVELVRYSMVPSLIGFLVTSGVLGFIAFKMRSDPDANRHGPPTLTSRR